MNCKAIAGLALTLALLTTNLAADELHLVHHVGLMDGESTMGQYAVMDKARGSDDTGSTVGLLEMNDGTRIVVSQRSDLVEGVTYERFEDLSSGWWAEKEFDFGFGNLSDPADFHDPMEAALETAERARREKAPETHTLTLSNGARVEWVVPWGEPGEGENAKKSALAELAAEVAKEPMPDSTLEALRVFAHLHQRSQPVEVVTESIIELLWDAARAAHESPPTARTLQVVNGDVEERPRILKTTKRNIEGP